MQLEEVFKIVATLEWGRDENDVFASQSIAYSASFIHRVKVLLATENKTLLFGEDLFIDGSETFLETDLNEAT